MFAFVITIKLIFFIASLAIAFWVGFLLRSARISGMQKKLQELEDEIRQSHAEILELQQLQVTVAKEHKEHIIPVIPMKAKEENKKIIKN